MAVTVMDHSVEIEICAVQWLSGEM